MPGRSLSGKTSLVAALVAAGADYYSDEFAVMDREGRIYPYQRRLVLRQGSGKKPVRRSATDLGGRNGTGPLPLGLILVTKYSEDAAWDPREISAADAAMHLFANTILAQERPQFSWSVLTRAVAECHAVQSERPEASAIATTILELADRGLDRRL